MFKHQGPSRSPRQNAILAAYLALVGGFVNSAGFVLIGQFTSHVTGNIGRLANDVASREWSAAGGAAAMIVAFFCGAFVASMIIESEAFGSAAYAYGTSLALEALLLFAVLATFTAGGGSDRIRSLDGATLCAAMGVQNSLVTRLSGAVIRTTHLTGVVTDLGIESARWFRWLRGRATDAWRVKLSFGATPPERPAGRIGLLGIIAAAFTCGAIAGAAGATAFRHMALALPLVSLVAGAAYAFASGRSVSSRRVDR